MTDRATLLALASRVEAATGADNGIDSEIHHAVLNGVGVGSYGAQPTYTASLDAAMSLVDLGEGIGKPGHAYFPNICRATRDLGGSAYWWVSISHCFDRYRGEAATLPLALTAASLRAIAGSMTDD